VSAVVCPQWTEIDFEASDGEGCAMTKAHDQRMTLHILTHVPEHEPREDDPHYHLFERVKARMKRQGLWKCVINDDYCDGNVELHHSHVEYSQINSIDIEKVNAQLGLDLDDDDEFQEWIESPGNLEPLCVVHHRTHFGVHVIPGPLWEPLRYRRKGAKPSAEFLTADEAMADPENTVIEKKVKTTTTRRRPTAKGVEADIETDETDEVAVVAPDHHLVEAKVERRKAVQHKEAAVPRPRAAKKEEKKGFFGRLFGG
jgi:hypothetical protein